MGMLENHQFELERRVILFKPTTTMPDNSLLGYDGDPNDVIEGNSDGEFLLYNSPYGTMYIQSDGTEWRKKSMPNEWVELGAGGSGAEDLEYFYTAVVKVGGASGWAERVTHNLETHKILFNAYLLPDYESILIDYKLETINSIMIYNDGIERDIYVVISSAEAVINGGGDNNTGIMWRETSNNSGVSAIASAYGNGQFAFLQYNSSHQYKLFLSNDGEHFVSKSIGADDNQWEDIAFGNGRFVAVASSGTQRVITNEEREPLWYLQNSIDDSLEWTAIGYGDGVFTAVASNVGNYTCAMHSSDGKTWGSENMASTDNQWESVIYGNDCFVAVASSGTYRIQSKRKNLGGYYNNSWQYDPNYTETDNYEWKAVAYGNDKFVAISNSKVATSTYGYTGWSVYDLPKIEDWNDIIYNEGKFIAISSSNDPDCRFLLSYDGINWSCLTDNSKIINGAWRTITYGNGLFVTTEGKTLVSGRLQFANDYESHKYSGSKLIYGDLYVDGEVNIAENLQADSVSGNTIQGNTGSFDNGIYTEGNLTFGNNNYIFGNKWYLSGVNTDMFVKDITIVYDSLALPTDSEQDVHIVECTNFNTYIVGATEMPTSPISGYSYKFIIRGLFSKDGGDTDPNNLLYIKRYFNFTPTDTDVPVYLYGRGNASFSSGRWGSFRTPYFTRAETYGSNSKNQWLHYFNLRNNGSDYQIYVKDVKLELWMVKN